MVVWVVTMVLPAAALEAVSVGSPASLLKKGKWTFGMEGSAAPSRQLKGGPDVSVYHVAHFRGYGLTDWLSVYGLIGGAYVSANDSAIKVPNTSNSTHSFGGNLIAGGQMKVKMWESRSKTWEWDGSLQYIDIVGRHKDKNIQRWHEWQLATSTAKAFGRFKPYAGMKLSVLSMFYKIQQNQALISQGHYKTRRPVGAFLGADFTLSQRDDVVLNLEADYLDGAELGMAIAYSF